MPNAGPDETSIAVALVAAIDGYFAATGYAPVQVARGFQPTAQGQQVDDVLYFHALPAVRRGWPQRKDVFDPDTQSFVHTESTQFEQTYQFAAVLPPADPANPRRTAMDVAKAASFAMQSDRVMLALRAASLGVLRISDVYLGYSVDDRGQFEPQPMFDAVLTYRNTFSDRVEVVTDYALEIHRV